LLLINDERILKLGCKDRKFIPDSKFQIPKRGKCVQNSSKVPMFQGSRVGKLVPKLFLSNQPLML
jgi:hypothetical protein